MQAKTFPSMCVNERLPKWRQFSLQPLTPVVCVPPGVLELGGGVAQDVPTAGLLLALQSPHAVGWITKHMVIGWFVSVSFARPLFMLCSVTFAARRNYSWPTLVPASYTLPVLFRTFGYVGLRRVACRHCVLALVRSRRGRLLVITRVVSLYLCAERMHSILLNDYRVPFLCGVRVERLARPRR